MANYFGTPFSETTRKKWVDEIPEISRLDSTYKTEDAKPKDPKLHRGSGWHTDHSFKEYPPKATLLHAHEIPSQAGQTRFCNTRKAFDDLPEATKRRLDGLMAVHSYDTERAPAPALARTAEEIAEREADSATAATEREAAEAADAKRAEDKASGDAKLKALGLTEDEIAAR